MIKLSELPSDTLIGREEMTPMRVSDVIEEMRMGEPHADHVWYLTETHYWRPDAAKMVNRYLENESDEMYEDWDERADDVFGMLIPQIQALMDELTDLHKEHVSVYYTCGDEIEFDIDNIIRTDGVAE